MYSSPEGQAATAETAVVSRMTRPVFDPSVHLRRVEVIFCGISLSKAFNKIFTRG